MKEPRTNTLTVSKRTKDRGRSCCWLVVTSSSKIIARYLCNATIYAPRTTHALVRSYWRSVKEDRKNQTRIRQSAVTVNRKHSLVEFDWSIRDVESARFALVMWISTGQCWSMDRRGDRICLHARIVFFERFHLKTIDRFHRGQEHLCRVPLLIEINLQWSLKVVDTRTSDEKV